MKNTPKNRKKFLQGYLKILLLWKNKKQDVGKMKKSLRELNVTLPNPKERVVLYENMMDLGTPLRTDLGTNLWTNLRTNLWTNLWTSLRTDLRTDLGTSLGTSLWTSLWTDLWTPLRTDLGTDLRTGTWEYYEFIWPIFIAYFYKDLLTVKKRLSTIKALDKCIKAGVGYLWLSDTTLYALPFPEISIDEEKQLHCENGPACEWVGREKSWWVHGVKVTQKIVETPDKLTKQDWLNEKNLEVRRIIKDRMGENFVKKIGGKTVGKHKDPRIGEVVEIDISPDPEKVAHYLHAKDWSTGRKYYLGIPPTITDPMEAQAWCYSNDKVTFTKNDFEKLYKRILGKEVQRT